MIYAKIKEDRKGNYYLEIDPKNTSPKYLFDYKDLTAKEKEKLQKACEDVGITVFDWQMFE